LSQPLACNEIADGAIVERYVAGKLSSDLTDRFEIHLLDCGRCQTEVQLAWAVRKGIGTGDASSGSECDSGVITMRLRHRFSRVAIGAAVAAAAAAILLFAVPSLRVGDTSSTGDPHRGPEHDTPSVPVPIAPVGTVDGVEEIHWTSVAIADRYRLTLLDQDGSIRWEFETVDTFATFPDRIVLEQGAAYYWTVDARIGFDRWVESELAAFRLASLGTSRR
jgi:hypothetical protein